ncbi:MAG: hypothetical protein SFU53_14625 [Terrimicrobiaceae bacterium]|nr:hypothetical protein [Terrimicrobiaceae bacterium]
MAASSARRIPEDRAPSAASHWTEQGVWPASWLHPSPNPPVDCGVYFLAFFAQAIRTRWRLSASGLYELWIDGACYGRGPENGWHRRWAYDVWEIEMEEGSHEVAVRVWTGRYRAFPGSRPGVGDRFVLCAEKPLEISTGSAAWKWFPETAVRLGHSDHRESATGATHWDLGKGCLFEPTNPSYDPVKGSPAREVTACLGESDEPLIAAAELPDLFRRKWTDHVVRMSEGPLSSSDWTRWLRDGKLAVPAGSRVRVVCDLQSYLCFDPELSLGGGSGAIVRMRSMEALMNEPDGGAASKGDRAEGTFTSGVFDTCRTDGRELTFRPHWFRCGRFLEIEIETDSEPLDVGPLVLWETRMNLADVRTFECEEKLHSQIAPVAIRTLQCCSHWTLVDCPYYEQGQWLGDARIQALCHYVAWPSNPLVKKFLRAGAEAPLVDGVPPAFFPGDPEVRIPSFAFWWVCAVCDYALWRGDRSFVGDLARTARRILDDLAGRLANGGTLPGWKFADWAWQDGIPPGAEEGDDAFHPLLAIYILERFADVEEWLREPELAARWRRLAGLLVNRVLERFLRNQRIVDCRDGASSEHVQSLVALSKSIPMELRKHALDLLKNDVELTRTRLFFRHYVFEAAGLGADSFAPWTQLLQRNFSTFPETEEPTRSDCHAWSAHPLYHLATQWAGIRPAAFGFEAVSIDPKPPLLEAFVGRVSHQKGLIEVSGEVATHEWVYQITLPPGLPGRFHGADLKPGAQVIRVPFQDSAC